jgi:hypothetical protein
MRGHSRYQLVFSAATECLVTSSKSIPNEHIHYLSATVSAASEVEPDIAADDLFANEDGFEEPTAVSATSEDAHESANVLAVTEDELFIATNDSVASEDELYASAAVSATSEDAQHCPHLGRVAIVETTHSARVIFRRHE